MKGGLSVSRLRCIANNLVHSTNQPSCVAATRSLIALKRNVEGID